VDDPVRLLADAVARHPAQPLVTGYDGRTGERAELSSATAANWAAKIAGLLTDELGAQPGERVGILLPPHWQAAVVLLGCWTAGLPAAPGDESAPVVVATEDRIADLGPRTAVLATSLAPLGGGLTAPTSAVVDLPVAARACPDRFVGPPPAPDDPLLRLAAGEFTGVELVAAARAATDRWRLHPGDRLLSIQPWDTLDGVLAGLVVPLLIGGGVVLCRDLDGARLAQVAADERVAGCFGADVAGVRRL
jgi:uncharacterized protein (TIGR03089 family)